MVTVVWEPIQPTAVAGMIYVSFHEYSNEPGINIRS